MKKNEYLARSSVGHVRVPFRPYVIGTAQCANPMLQVESSSLQRAPDLIKLIFDIQLFISEVLYVITCTGM